MFFFNSYLFNLSYIVVTDYPFTYIRHTLQINISNVGYYITVEDESKYLIFLNNLF